MEPTYRVVFQGELAPGFELSAVKQSATVRLKAPVAMVKQMFSSRRVILKKGVSLEIGSRYLQELENMGMKARLEPEESGAQPLPSVATETTAQQAPSEAKPLPVQASGPDPLDAPVQDLSAYAPRTESAPEPVFGSPNPALTPISALAGTEETVFIPRKESSVVPSVEIEKTVFVPRQPQGPKVIQGLPSDQTIVVPRRLGEAVMPDPSLSGSEAKMIVPRPASPNMSPTLPPNGAAEATLIVPRTNPPPAASEATVFVPRKPEKSPEPGFDAERSLIASAETLAQYFSAASAATTDDPALLDESGLQASIREPVDKPNRGSSDKTEIVNAYPSQRKPMSVPIPRKGSNDTTVFVPPPPRRGSSEPTVMASLDEPLGSEADYGEEAPAPKRGSRLFFALLVLAALGAGLYYYFAMH